VRLIRLLPCLDTCRDGDEVGSDAIGLAIGKAQDKLEALP
jgi:hypothetical protein